MKRFVVPVALFLLCLALPASLAARDKKQPPPMAGMDRVFVGWVALDPELYFDLGYSRAEWEDVILHENLKFQENLKRQCSRRTVAGAKDAKDQNTAGNDLHIKFSDVSFSSKYVLYLSVQFIDLKTNTVVAVVDYDHYYGSLCGLERCLEKELDQVNQELQEQLSCKPARK
jgi:hypothetical protein